MAAASALSLSNKAKAGEVLASLESNLLLHDAVALPQSGEKALLVMTSGRPFENLLRQALDLVKRWMVEVEGFTGVYHPSFVVVSVATLNDLCGQASGQDEDEPGIVTLDLGCVQDRTVVHELAHVFVGTGPIWFTEGSADMLVFHQLGTQGNYYARRSTGKIEINVRRRSGDSMSSESYRNQGSLGAKFLVEVYHLLGREAMSQALQRMMTVEWPREGAELLDALKESTPESLQPQLDALIADRFAPFQRLR